MLSYSVTKTLGGRTAPDGKTFLVLNTVWKNIIPLTKVAKHPQHDATFGAGGLGMGGGAQKKPESPDDYEMKPTPYVVPEMPNHAFVIVNGAENVTISDATSAAVQPLPLKELVVPELNAEVHGQLVYEIPERDVTSLQFQFFDFSMGSFSIPLYGTPPPMPAPVAGPAGNGLLEISVLGVREEGQIGGRSAPAGQKLALVQLAGVGKSAGSLVRVELEKYTTLRDTQGYSFPASTDGRVPGQFQGMVQFLPDVPQRGALIFQVPEQHGPLTLVVNMPGSAPIELKLPGGATAATAPAAPPAPVLFTITDGDTLDVQVHGLRAVASLAGGEPAPGKRFLVLDVTIVNKVGSGIEVQTGEQLKLLNGSDEIRADPGATDRLPHPLKENSVVPPHGRGRFEVAYQAPMTASNFVLHYRGFKTEDKRPLTVQ